MMTKRTMMMMSTSINQYEKSTPERKRERKKERKKRGARRTAYRAGVTVAVHESNGYRR
jgi:hypothetical protein